MKRQKTPVVPQKTLFLVDDCASTGSICSHALQRVVQPWGQKMRGYHAVEVVPSHPDQNGLLRYLKERKSKMWGVVISAGMTMESGQGAECSGVRLMETLRQQREFEDYPLILVSLEPAERVSALLTRSTQDINSGPAGAPAIELGQAGCYFAQLPCKIADLKAVFDQARQYFQNPDLGAVRQVRKELDWQQTAKEMKDFNHHLLENRRAAFRILRGAVLDGAISHQTYESILLELKRRNKRDADFCEKINNQLKQVENWPPQSSKPNKRPGSLRVLLIDDEAENLGWDLILDEGLKTTLGAEVICESVAAQGVARATSDLEHFDVVLLDLNFQGQQMRGLDALQQIKKLKPGLPVIIFTGSNYYHELEQCIKLRNVSVFLKELRDEDDRNPVAYFQNLRSKIEKAVEHAPQHVFTELLAMGRKAWGLPEDDRMCRFLAQSIDFLDEPRISLMMAGLAFEHFAYRQTGLTGAAGDRLEEAVDILLAGKPKAIHVWARICRLYRNRVSMHDDIDPAILHEIDAEIFLWCLLTLLREYLPTGTDTLQDWPDKIENYRDRLMERVRAWRTVGDIEINEQRLKQIMDVLAAEQLRRKRVFNASVETIEQALKSIAKNTDTNNAMNSINTRRKHPGAQPAFGIASVLGQREIWTVDYSIFPTSPENLLIMSMIATRLLMLR